MLHRRATDVIDVVRSAPPQILALNMPVLCGTTLAVRSAMPMSDKHKVSGSSDIRWGSWGESAGGEEHAEPVVVPVAVAAGEAAVELDDPVDGLGAAVG